MTTIGEEPVTTPLSTESKESSEMNMRIRRARTIIRFEKSRQDSTIIEYSAVLPTPLRTRSRQISDN